MSVDTKASLAPNLIFARIFGFWAPRHTVKAKFYTVYSAIMYVTLVLPMPIASIMYFATKENIAVTEITDSAYMVSELTAYIFRMMFWLRREKLIKQTIETLNDPIFNKQNADQDKYLELSSLKVRRVFQVFLGCCTVALLAWASVPLFAKKRILPLDVWYPFDPLENTIAYVLVYAHIFLAVAGCTIINVSTGTIVSGLMIHATGQLQVLKSTFQQLGQYVKFNTCHINGDSDEMDNVIYGKITACIKHHQKIIEFVKNIETCFGMYTVAQFMAGSCIICTTAVELSIISPRHFKFYWMLSYMICMLLELLLFCWFGTELYYESTSLIDAVYSSDWYKFGPKSKKALFILMERSKRPLRVRAAKLFDLSLQTYTKILRGAYSLFAVVQHLMHTDSDLE